MRSTLISALVVVIGTAALAQAAPGPAPATLARPGTGYTPHPPAAHCCREKVWDKAGKAVGDLIAWDEQGGYQKIIGWIAYRLPDGDAVTLRAAPESITSLDSSGGSNTLFTTPDCSGNVMFATLTPTLAKRYAMVLLAGWPPMTNAQTAWLWVTDPLPTRVIPGAGTVFHSQWSDSNTCSPYPAPGFTLTNQPGGFWMHRVEDIYAKFKRPFYMDH
jgi:hypothetical protein